MWKRWYGILKMCLEYENSNRVLPVFHKYFVFKVQTTQIINSQGNSWNATIVCLCAQMPILGALFLSYFSSEFQNFYVIVWCTVRISNQCYQIMYLLYRVIQFCQAILEVCILPIKRNKFSLSPRKKYPHLVICFSVISPRNYKNFTTMYYIRSVFLFNVTKQYAFSIQGAPTLSTIFIKDLTT